MEHRTNSVAQQRSSQYYFYCYLSQRSKDHHTKWDSRLFPHHQGASEKFMIHERIFSTAVCFQCRLCGCFASTGRQQGIPTWVALKLQSIMCDRGSVTTMQSWQYTHTQPCALNHRCIHTHTHLQICACPPSLWVSWSRPSVHMKQGVMGKELLSGSAAAKHIVASVIQASESTQITTTPSPELQLACNEAWEKKRKGVKQITPEEPSGARTEIYLNWSRARSVVALSLMLKFTHSSTPVICQRKTNDAVAAMKTIISE